jgi:hypothetical protein
LSRYAVLRPLSAAAALLLGFAIFWSTEGTAEKPVQAKGRSSNSSSFNFLIRSFDKFIFLLFQKKNLGEPNSFSIMKEEYGGYCKFSQYGGFENNYSILEKNDKNSCIEYSICYVL